MKNERNIGMWSALEEEWVGIKVRSYMNEWTIRVVESKRRTLQAEVQTLEAGEKFQEMKNIKMKGNEIPKPRVKHFRNMKSVEVLPIKLLSCN